MGVKKPKPNEVMEVLLDIMNGEPMNARAWLPWPHKYLVALADEDRRECYRITKDNLVRPISIEAVASDILCYLNDHTPRPLFVSFDLAQKIARTFVASHKVSDLPPLTREFEDQELCFHRFPFPFERVHKTELKERCPLFSDILNRIKCNQDAFVQFLGSCTLNDGIDFQQFLLMRGRGTDGKGSIISMLAALHGPAFISAEEQDFYSAHWTHCIDNKRICAFGDVDDPGFVQHGKFKSITGGDPISVNPKGKPHKTIRPKIQFILATNQEHDLSGLKSDARRLIYVEFERSGVKIPNYSELLMGEAPAIFGYCKDQYMEHAGGREIKTSSEATEALLETAFEVFDGFVEQYTNPLGESRPVDLRTLFSHKVSSRQKEWHRFKTYLTEYRGVQIARIDNRRRFQGISIRPNIVLPIKRREDGGVSR